ncbi:hypothetical protein S40293_03692 [Stachybotrys chartarum IBT 40293]|nr:hypothetical protein S40293_03692 [Stachybotrys chartarum IBT 40293]
MTDDAAAAGALACDHDASLAQSPGAAAAAAAAAVAVDQSFTSQDDDTLLSSSSLTLACEKHPKGKRKRTAAKDKTVLEEAYLANPKPDKQARLEIVERVSLNEKEVQIWFQNRRQNDRRKSRPLSAQEIEALRYNGLNPFSSDPATSTQSFLASDKICPTSDPVLPQHNTAAPTSPMPASSSPESSQSQTRVVDEATPLTAHPESSQGTLPAETEPNDEPPSSQLSKSELQGLSQSFNASVGYLSNRWNLGNSVTAASHNDSSRHVDLLSPASFRQAANLCHRRESFASSCLEPSDTPPNSQSRMRLSLSLDGKAELVSNAPSPTRPAPERSSSSSSSAAAAAATPAAPTLPQVRRGLSRSHSALPSITLPPISALTSLLPPRLPRGRSRDVHAWELCADADTPDELTTQAENESNGSAIAAISLLRSSSGVLQPSGSKRNASMTRQARPEPTKKPKLSQIASNAPKLGIIYHEFSTPQDGGKIKMARLVSPTDSDKENWSPDEEGGAPRRRPLPSTAPSPKPQDLRRRGRILQDHMGPPLLGGRAHTAPSPRPRTGKDAIDVFDDSEPRALPPPDEDVERFMRGSISPSKKPDMDCVAGLLSLSQGAWK